MREQPIKDSARTSSTSLDFKVGEIIDGRYQIESFLGEGGMSVAYKATDLRFARTVALKFLLPDRLTSEKDLLRFRREAQTSSKLDHPSISRVLEFALLGDRQPYLVMEYVDGQTLAEQIQAHGQLPIKETVDIFMKVCDALEYAHSKNVLHRDIKPSNIIVQQSTDKPLNVKLLDFGIAKLMHDSKSISQHITETGEVVGSPYYMSPEQARGGELDCRSDLYSLGCALYEALTGGPPHVGQTPLATILKRETDKPITLAEASLGRAFPKDLEVIVSKLLQTDPSNRYQSAAELKAALSQTEFADFSAVSSEGDSTTAEERRGKSRMALAILAVSSVAFAAVPAIAFWLVQTNSPQLIKPIAPVQPLVTPVPTDVPEVTSFESKQLLTNAQDHERHDEYPLAVKYYKQAIDAYLQSKDPASSHDLVFAFSKLASCLRQLGSYDEATKSVQDALVLCRNRYGEQSSEYATALSSEGANYLEGKSTNRSEAWREAKPLYDRAVAICDKLHERTSDRIVTLLRYQADSCLRAHLTDEGQARYERALDYCRKSPPDEFALHPLLICSLTALYCGRHHFEKTRPLYKELLASFEISPVGQRWQIGEYLATYAKHIESINYKTKDTLEIAAQAQELYKRVYNVYSGPYGQFREPDNNRLGKLAQAVASTYRIQGEYGVTGAYAQAEAWYRKAKSNLQTQMGAPSMDRLSAVDLALSDVLCTQKRYAEAKRLCNDVVLRYKMQGAEDTPPYARALGSLASLEISQKDSSAAEAHFDQAHQIYAKCHLSYTGGDISALIGIAHCKTQPVERLRILLRVRPMIAKFAPYSPMLKSVDDEIKEAQGASKTRS
jgi:serine/threonine protein kinase